MGAVLLVIIAVAAVYFVLKLVKQRAAAFAAAAEPMGFAYSTNVSPFTGTDLDGLPLLTLSKRHVFRNVLTAKSGSPVVVSEFQYMLLQGSTSGGIGDGSRGGNHTIIGYRIPKGSLPKFQVYSHGIFGNMNMPVDKQAFRGMFGKGGLDLGNEAFAKRYMVICDEANATAVRMLFTPFLMHALLEQPPRTWLHIQCSADWLLFYDPMIMVLKPEAVAPALARLAPIVETITGKPAPVPAGAPQSATSALEPAPKPE